MTYQGTSATESVVLVVDDEENIAMLVQMALELSGHTVLTAHSSTDAASMLADRTVDLIVLDVLLGDEDGFDLLDRLRRRGVTAPVLYLTALDDVADKVRGLSLGDDYMTKPFRVEELVARVHALLRRSGRADAHQLHVGDLELDEDTYSVHRAGVAISLTPTEFKLLRLLMQNVGKVVSREQILDTVWEYDFGGRANVDTYISYLRKKIDGDFPHQMLTTVRGFGYTLKPGD